MTNIEYTRQMEWFNPDKYSDTNVAVVGCGGIGSFLVLYLAQMGIKNITVYDDDKVEAHNLPNQNFDLRHIGMFKVCAMQEIVRERTGIKINAVNKRVGKDTKFDCDVLMLGTDTISSREMCLRNAKSSDVKCIIDGRLGGQYYQVFTVDMHNPDEVYKYQQYFFPQSEQEQPRCTAKAIIYIALDITSDMIRHMRAWLMDYEYPTVYEVNREHNEITADGNVFVY